MDRVSVGREAHAHAHTHSRRFVSAHQRHRRRAGRSLGASPHAAGGPSQAHRAGRRQEPRSHQTHPAAARPIHGGPPHGRMAHSARPGPVQPPTRKNSSDLRAPVANRRRRNGDAVRPSILRLVPQPCCRKWCRRAPSGVGRLFSRTRVQAVASTCSSVGEVAYSLPSRSWIRPARIWRCTAAPIWFGRSLGHAK